MSNSTNITIICIECIALASALMAVFSKYSPAHVVLYLILTFTSTSIIFIILDMDLIAIFFIIIYAGALMILFLFIIMMFNLKQEGQHLAQPFFLSNLLCFVVPIVFCSVQTFALMVNILKNNDSKVIFTNLQNYYTESFKFITNQDIGEYYYGLNIKNLNNSLYITHYPSIYIVALILLLGIISAIFLTLEKNHEVKMQTYYKQIIRSNSVRLIKDCN